VNHAEDEEALHFLDNYSLIGKRLGHIDMHLIVSAPLTKVPIWTLDKKLREVSSKMRLKH